jgi:hypothetical protein
MRMRAKVIAAGVLAGVLCAGLGEGDAQAQIPPIVERDPNWDAVSQISTVVGVATVALMPRVYYSSPDATVGWKARWHVSYLAPVMTMTTAALLVDGPVREAIQSPRPGCTVDDTLARLPDSGCETFGGPSTHAFAAWGAFGAGTTIFLVDTFNYSDFEFHWGGFVGNVMVPLTAAILTSVARSADGRGLGPEDTGQVVAGALPGIGVGALFGLGYSLFQEPDCGYGGYLFCW